MRATAAQTAFAVSSFVLLSGLTAISSVHATDISNIAEGKKIAFGRERSNCLACHMIDDGFSPGDIGPL